MSHISVYRVRMISPKLDGRVAVDDARMLVLRIVEALVDDPASIELRSDEVNSSTTCFQLLVSPSDIGRLIGKQGRTARSIRIVLSAVSMKSGHRYTLDI